MQAVTARDVPADPVRRADHRAALHHGERRRRPAHRAADPQAADGAVIATPAPARPRSRLRHLRLGIPASVGLGGAGGRAAGRRCSGRSSRPYSPTRARRRPVHHPRRRLPAGHRLPGPRRAQPRALRRPQRDRCWRSPRRARVPRRAAPSASSPATPRSLADSVLMRGVDLLLAFPPLLFLLLLAAGIGAGPRRSSCSASRRSTSPASRASSAPRRSRSRCAATSRPRSPAASAPARSWRARCCPTSPARSSPTAACGSPARSSPSPASTSSASACSRRRRTGRR